MAGPSRIPVALWFLMGITAVAELNGAVQEDSLTMTQPDSISIDGENLAWWQLCYTQLPERQIAELSKFRISFTDLGDQVKISFRNTDSSGQMLGGGHGTCLIDKTSRQVISLKFIR